MQASSPRLLPGSLRILIFAPTGNDGQVTSQFLSQAGHDARVCRQMDEICREAESDCGAILLAEETLTKESVKALASLFERQPTWSDLPLTVVTSGAESRPERLRILSAIGPRANVTLLERPFRRNTLLSAIEVGLRARQRQYQVCDLLAERTEAQTMLERVVQERTGQLSETNEQLETLVYSIAHDLRAPLRSMQAFANILLEDYTPQLDTEAVRYAQRIVKSAEAMDTLVLDLLAYGKAVRSEITFESVDLGLCWANATSLLEQDIADQTASIRTASPLPHLWANASILVQVLTNLLGNSLKFVVPGVPPVILLDTEDRGDMVRVSLKDNGIGIAPEYHEKIFRVFERLNKGTTEGTGIGLALVRKGIERMGGRVGLESGPPLKGSRFWFELKKAVIAN